MTDYQYKIESYILHFKQPAGTSRGIYTERKIWLLSLWKTDAPERIGLGECAPLPQLSCDDLEDYEEILNAHCARFVETGILDYEGLRDYPSMLMGLETAIWSLWSPHCRETRTSPSASPQMTAFAQGTMGIPINGLIWMGDASTMLSRIQDKLRQGFRCIKLKIGAIDFEEEMQLLQYIRQHYSSKDIVLRVDANGAFAPDKAMDYLERLAALDMHSIEQPIMAGQWDKMAYLCQNTPLPIALDEELIGVNDPFDKMALLETIRPQYIILKPSLHGGFHGSSEWIRLAKERGIGYWITSALESNVGLNAIAQWTATQDVRIPQGLGTGQLFENNISMPLEIRGDQLFYTGQNITNNP